MLIRLTRFSTVICLVLSLTASSALSSTKKAAQSKQAAKAGEPQTEAALRARAERLHRASIVIDTHNDITSPMLEEGFDLGMRGDDPNAKVKTHTDLRRMKEGGLDAEFFAVYVGREFVGKKPSEGGGAARRTLDVINSVYEQVRR